jgi:anti-anti-sigma regulatory factor
MEIIISQNQDSFPAAIMQLHGDLDGSSYQYFIDEAQKLYDAGTRNLLLDMSEMNFLSSAGLAGLHRIARVYNGEDRSTMEEGWSAIHAMGKERESGFQKHVKLLNPNERVLDVLDTVGFKTFFEIFSEIDPAMASFQ